jgi:PEP-CTERM motif
MNMLKTLAVAVALAGAGASSVSGAVLVDETFTYGNGNLVGQNPPVGTAWAAHSAAGTRPVQVTSGAAVISHGSSGEDINIGFEGGATAGAGETMYSSFDLTVPDPAAAVVTSMFAHFLQGTTNFTARVYVTAPTTSGFRLAISNDSSITDADGEAFSGDLSFGTTYKIVTSYNFDTTQGTLWINPVTSGSPSITATDPGFSNAVAAYAMRQDTTGNTSQTIDNLLVGESFAEVIPEPTSLALLSLGGLGLLRRHRRGR